MYLESYAGSVTSILDAVNLHVFGDPLDMQFSIKLK